MRGQGARRGEVQPAGQTQGLGLEVLRLGLRQVQAGAVLVDRVRELPLLEEPVRLRLERLRFLEAPRAALAAVLRGQEPEKARRAGF